MLDLTAQAKPGLLDVPRAELLALLNEIGQPSYRLKQIFKWVFQHGAVSFEEMTDLPAALRVRLSERYHVLPLNSVRVQQSSDGWTVKSLFALEGATPAKGARVPARQTIESVLMRYDPTDSQRGRLTVCASSQAGCAVGCSFCATGQARFSRNLTAGEIVGQVLAMGRLAAEGEGRVTNVVMMGQGEPMLNLEAVWQAITIMNDPDGLAIGARHITLSTVGIIPGILEVARRNPPIRLAVSLHAPDDELRSELVPINRRYPIADLMTACAAYCAATGRRITFEYPLLGGLNDSPALARQLVKRIGNLPAHVNLIPVNPTPGAEFVRPSAERANAFRDILQNAHIPTTIRTERGIDIFAGCGQLRADDVAGAK